MASERAVARADIRAVFVTVVVAALRARSILPSLLACC